MNKCKCGARWNINYPFGRNSKPRVSFTKHHAKDCRYRKEQKKERW